MNDLITAKRKNSLSILKEIDTLLEKQFYHEFSLAKDKKVLNNELFTVHEDLDDKEHEDLEEQEQEWFNTQLE